ncbi:uncharacterized protein LOC135430815 [Drosophila montana]|uniref:uncharacterized protein LOC135430815 n=1 Tax=Drosophila montana TaxID=40370 RepID=UPI00313E9408
MLSSEIYTNTTTATAAAAATATATAVATASSSTMNAFSGTLQVVRTKKRRKRRKRAGHATGCGKSNGNDNGSSSSNPAKAIVGCVAATASTVSGGRKRKAQYFQHDNREYIAKYESFHFTAQATTAAALNYAAVAKKFKPVLASGAKKNRRTAMSRKPPNDCACVCQNTQMTQCPQEVRTAVASQRAGESRKSDRTRNLKGQALPALLELLKHSSSTWLETLLLGAGKAAAAR